MSPIVIIGSGMAAYSLARTFRKLDSETPLLIITADDGRAYSKPMLSNALSKGKTPAALASADVDKMALQLKAEIRPHTRVSAIHTETHELLIGSETVSYSRLVLALGADPFRLSLHGDGADSVFSVNDLNDYDRFRNALDGKQSVAILGGGLIGCEFANDLANVDINVNLIDRNPFPLGKLLPEVMGQKLLMALEKLGVKWQGGDTVKRVDKEGERYGLVLESGAPMSVDLVLSAIGLSPRTTLAKDAGLQTNRGIVTDQYLQTSAPDVYALGDCAEVAGFNLPFVMPLMRSAKALAATLAGHLTPVTYPAMPVVLKTPAYPLSVYPPPKGIEGQWRIEEKVQSIHARFFDGDGVLQGFALGGDAVADSSTLAMGIPPLTLESLT
ncbi:MAG: FAD-dependent oxidoreductase [Gammaproteobacteria bacterium]|nr:FAD-dependent oxidoreductase [Gammaproteobacteria bacterium]